MTAGGEDNGPADVAPVRRLLEALAKDLLQTLGLQCDARIEEAREEPQEPEPTWDVTFSVGGEPRYEFGIYEDDLTEESAATLVSGIAINVQDHLGDDVRGWPRCPVHGDEMDIRTEESRVVWQCILDPHLRFPLGSLGGLGTRG